VLCLPRQIGLFLLSLIFFSPFCRRCVSRRSSSRINFSRPSVLVMEGPRLRLSRQPLRFRFCSVFGGTSRLGNRGIGGYFLSLLLSPTLSLRLGVRFFLPLCFLGDGRTKLPISALSFIPFFFFFFCPPDFPRARFPPPVWTDLTTLFLFFFCFRAI